MTTTPIPLEIRWEYLKRSAEQAEAWVEKLRKWFPDAICFAGESGGLIAVRMFAQHAPPPDDLIVLGYLFNRAGKLMFDEWSGFYAV